MVLAPIGRFADVTGHRPGDISTRTGRPAIVRVDNGVARGRCAKYLRASRFWRIGVAVGGC